MQEWEWKINYPGKWKWEDFFYTSSLPSQREVLLGRKSARYLNVGNRISHLLPHSTFFFSGKELGNLEGGFIVLYC